MATLNKTNYLQNNKFSQLDVFSDFFFKNLRGNKWIPQLHCQAHMKRFLHCQFNNVCHVKARTHASSSLSFIS